MRRNYNDHCTQHIIDSYDVIYVYAPEFPFIRREICDWQKCVRINMAAYDAGREIRTRRRPVLDDSVQL